MPLPSFILNDETKKNSHGFFLVNAGGCFDRFNENPVMLDNHNLDRLIGRWENLRVEGGLLKADPVFDEGVPLGVERKGQVERGFLRGASPGILPLEAEYRPNAVTGQQDLYVTKWELFENSTTPIPSNAGAIALKIYTGDGQLVPDEDVCLHMDNLVRLCAGKSQGQITNIKTMDKITLSAEAYAALGIAADAETAAISAAVVKLHGDLKTANDRVAELEAEKKTAHKQRAENLVKMAVESGRIVAADKEAYTELAIVNYSLAEKTLKAIPAKVNLSAQIETIHPISGIPAGREKWTHLHWLKEDPEGLAKIKSENPEVFEAIRKVRP